MSPQRALDWNAVVIGKGAAVPEKTILRGAANTVLTQTVVNDEPAFTKVNLASMVTGSLDLANVTGSLPVAHGGSGAALILLSYGTTTGVPDASAGNWFFIGVNNAAAHAVPAPINGTAGRMITLSIHNGTGGAIATATFHALYFLAAYAAPASGFMNSACLLSVGDGRWFQVTPWTSIAI